MTTPDIVDMTARVAGLLHRRDLAARRDVGPEPSPDDLDDADEIIHALAGQIRAGVLDEVLNALTRPVYVTWATSITPEEALFLSPVDQCRKMIEWRLGSPHV